MDRRTFLTTSTLASAGVLAAPAVGRAAPRAKLLDSRFARFGAGGGPDHSAWQAILDAQWRMGADGIARMRYDQIDRGALGGYLDTLQAVDPRDLSPQAAFAYWVNFYNALTVMVVAQAYPVRSIRRIGGSLIAPGPWRERRVEVIGVALSLDDIEHGILRPVWREPRVHYAVNCAALGCPNLAGRAYRAANAEALLEDGAISYVNHDRGLAVAGGALRISSIYRWFAEDFGDGPAGLRAHLARYATGARAEALAAGLPFGQDGYDWALNGA